MQRIVRGTIRYTSDQPARLGAERGREHFMWTDQSDGVRVVHAHCEIDDAPSIVRDVVMAIDATGRPLDAHMRLTVGGRFEGVGFFRFGERSAECEAFNRYVFLRGQVGGYMQTRYELVELVR